MLALPFRLPFNDSERLPASLALVVALFDGEDEEEEEADGDEEEEEVEALPVVVDVAAEVEPADMFLRRRAIDSAYARAVTGKSAHIPSYPPLPAVENSLSDWS